MHKRSCLERGRVFTTRTLSAGKLQIIGKSAPATPENTRNQGRIRQVGLAKRSVGLQFGRMKAAQSRSRNLTPGGGGGSQGVIAPTAHQTSSWGISGGCRRSNCLTVPSEKQGSEPRSEEALGFFVLGFGNTANHRLPRSSVASTPSTSDGAGKNDGKNNQSCGGSGAAGIQGFPTPSFLLLGTSKNRVFWE